MDGLTDRLACMQLQHVSMQQPLPMAQRVCFESRSKRCNHRRWPDFLHERMLGVSDSLTHFVFIKQPHESQPKTMFRWLSMDQGSQQWLVRDTVLRMCCLLRVCDTKVCVTPKRV